LHDLRQGKEDRHDPDGAVTLKEQVDALLGVQIYPHEGRSVDDKMQQRTEVQNHDF
jgi:hypothetical protein